MWLHMASETVLFESWRGRYADGPRAVSERLAELRGDLRRIWVVDSPSVDLPDDVGRVVRNTPQYFYRLATARYFFASDMMPRYPLKSRRTTYVQMWHGTPLKRIGFDVPEAQYADAAVYLQRLARDIDRWDYLVSPSEFCTQMFRKAFRYDGPVLQTGYPRNDVLSGPTAAYRREQIRAQLGISPGTRAVLYAPTWRDNALHETTLELDAVRLLSSLETDTVLLLRFHHLLADKVQAPDHPQVLDVSAHPDIKDLYLAADAMVTDYSSTMFDYAVTGRPMIFFAYDLANYRDELRGFYFDFEAEAPGPIVDSTDGVIDALNRLDTHTAAYAQRYAEFAARFCPLEDGHASDRVIEAVLGE
jgi:CDP-glycerol glycerophosphotransferase